MNFRPASSTKLPRRDLVILPLLSFFTLFLLLGSTELTARHFLVSHEADSCQEDNPKIGFSFRPNCTSHLKTAEGPWVENYYNDCGYRTKESCGPKPKGSTRIALIGSSVAEGYLVDYQETLSARTSKELSARCRKQVEVQNLGRLFCSVGCMYHRVDEALALKPDLLILTLSPYDIETTLPSDVTSRFEPIPPFHSSHGGAAEAQQNRIFLRRIHTLIKNSRTADAAEHYIFQDPATYLRLYMLYGDKADFLRQPFSPAWEERFRNVDILIGEMAEKAKAAHTPFVILEMPDEPQVSVLLAKTTPPETDASALNRRIGEIAARYGIIYVDPLSAFRSSPGANKLFYVVNGHLNGEGYRYISNYLVNSLTLGDSPILPGCAPSATSASTKVF